MGHGDCLYPIHRPYKVLVWFYSFVFFWFRSAMSPVVYLLGHSFVELYRRRAAHDGQTVGQATGLARECQLQTQGVSGGTSHRLLTSPGDLLRRLETITCVLDLLVVDLGTNDLCPQDASPGLVVDSALALVELLRQSNRSPTKIVFLSVIQRTSKGRHLAVSVRRRAKAFNAKLAARVQFLPGVYFYSQPINHPRFICSDGCHLTDEGVQRYGEGIRRAVLRHRSG